MCDVSTPSAERLECAICLEDCLNAVRLDCGHIFCYLCVKGSAQQSNQRCPVCRQPIAPTYFDNPILMDSVEWKDGPEVDGQMQWQYEGRNGWWLYDRRTSRDIQKAFDADQSSLDVLIAGFVYVIDFDRMVQYRQLQPNRIRKIRRQALDPNTTKGVAGLRANFSDIPLQNNLNQSEGDSDQTVDRTGEHRETDTSSSVAIDPQNDFNSIEPNGSDSGDQRLVVMDRNGEEVIQLAQAMNTRLSLNDARETYL